MSAIHWLDDARFTLDHVAFHITIVERFASSSNNFQLVKHRQMVERYEALISSLQPKRIVELGIFQGGSAALFTLLAKPERLAAVDIKDDSTTCLEDFIDERGLRDRVHTHYGFDQSDSAGLRQLVASEFGGDQIDLVVDDASHLLGPTRASFNVLFPQLRPGGVFVVEDWSGQHRIDAALRAHMAADPSIHERLEEQLRSGQTAATPLSVLLFELILASAYAPRLFTEIVVTDGWAHVVRGPQEVDPDTFDLSRVYSDMAGALLTTTT
jgi:predicted O-methyltransferase YrrM